MTPAERRKLERATERLRRAEEAVEEARAAWASVVREIGMAAVARELGLSRQAVEARVRTAERRARR